MSFLRDRERRRCSRLSLTLSQWRYKRWPEVKKKEKEEEEEEEMFVEELSNVF